jgi:lipoate---protein ligase
MKLIRHTFSTPEENIACDDALLEEVEKGADEILRFWEPAQSFIVLGFSNVWKNEIDSNAPGNIPIIRRISGGGTVLQGPGCLNYSLILKLENHPETSGILSSNRYVMTRLERAFSELLGKAVRVQGSTDLTVEDLKFSGNAQRRKRKTLLFHGTFLTNFDLKEIERWLKSPPKQPAYRRNRAHRDFVMNIPIAPEKIISKLAEIWGAMPGPMAMPGGIITQLVREKYGLESWNLSR